MAAIRLSLTVSLIGLGAAMLTMLATPTVRANPDLRRLDFTRLTDFRLDEPRLPANGETWPPYTIQYPPRDPFAAIPPLGTPYGERSFQSDPFWSPTSLDMILTY